MAISQTITVTQQYSNNATSPSAVSFTAEPVVQDGRLIQGFRITNPGIFSPGTPREYSSSNPQNDSNA